MNISPINFTLFPNNSIRKSNNIEFRYNLAQDCVSFSGKKNIAKQEFSPEAQEAISLGKKILKTARSNALTQSALSDILNEKSPVEINVDSINNCPVKGLVAGKVLAHMLPMYTPDLKLATANLYIGSIPSTTKEEIDYIANVAHEYTHVLQRAKDDNYYGISNYTDDIQEIRTIARTAQSLMNGMIRTCQQELFKSEKDVNSVINSIINNKFNSEKSLNKIDFNEVIDSTALQLAVHLGKNPDDMKKAITGWIAQESKNEEEAYGVTLEILERAKHDPATKANRTLSKEIYSFINKKLEK